MPSAGAIVMFPSAVTGFLVAPAEAVAVAPLVAVAAPVVGAVAVEDCAVAVEDEAGAEDAAAPADDADVAAERDEADADGGEAVEDWLAEQPATARPASTAQAVATLTS